jgi:hypothetical protein
MKVDPRPGSLSTSDSKWCVFETVHISAHVIYAMLTEKALNPFVECTSGLIGGDGLSITLKLGLKRSIEHIRFLQTTGISKKPPRNLLLGDTRSSIVGANSTAG